MKLQGPKICQYHEPTPFRTDPFQVYADGKGPVYAYTPAGRLASRTWARQVGGNPLITSYAYDTAGGLTNLNYSDGLTPDVTNLCDRLGRPVTIIQGAMTTTAAYNLAGQRLSEAYAGGPLNGLCVSNTYDADMRRTTLAALTGTTLLLTTSYGYDPASRLATVNDGGNHTATYSYLANSPLVSQIVFATNGVTRMTTTKQYD